MDATRDLKAAEEFEVTRCPECYSDKVYAFEEAEGGMCTKCKLLISGPIRGGIGKHEMRRLRGELPPPEVKEEPPKPSPVAVTANNVKAVVASLGKSSTAIPAVSGPPKGPGVIQKTVGFIRRFQDEWKKTAPKETPKPPPAPVVPPSAPPAPSITPNMMLTAIKAMTPGPVAPAPVTPVTPAKLGPQIGETWQVGKCIICKNPPQKVAGTVVPTTVGRKYVTIRDSGGMYWSGCGLCAKKL